METVKAPITKRAIMARIQRKLKRDGEFLKSCSHRSSAYNTLGDYYIVNESNCIVATHQDLEDLGREMEVLKRYEEIEEQE